MQGAVGARPLVWWTWQRSVTARPKGLELYASPRLEKKLALARQDGARRSTKLGHRERAGPPPALPPLPRRPAASCRTIRELAESGAEGEVQVLATVVKIDSPSRSAAGPRQGRPGPQGTHDDQRPDQGRDRHDRRHVVQPDVGDAGPAPGDRGLLLRQARPLPRQAADDGAPLREGQDRQGAVQRRPHHPDLPGDRRPLQRSDPQADVGAAPEDRPDPRSRPSPRSRGRWG